MLPSVTDGFSNVRRSNRRMIAAIVVLALLWVVVMLTRHTIWARWWGYKLRTSADVGQRLDYLAHLAGLGDASVPVAAGLIRGNDMELRGYGVFLLSKVDSPAATAHLRTAVDDADPDIRRIALQAYGRRSTPDVPRNLTALMNDERTDVALEAAAQLALTRGKEAVPILSDAARKHANPGMRVQAIQLLAMIDAVETVDTLIECLLDTGVYQGQTAMEASADRAVKAVMSAGSLPTDLDLATNGPAPVHIVGEEADKALRRLTGQSFDYRSDDPAARESAIAAWRQWRSSQGK